jgi:PAS domain S-box-containing protein
MTPKDTRSSPAVDPAKNPTGSSEAESLQALRKRAQALANERAGEMPENLEALSPGQARRALHELRVHQIELEMQNEELRRTHAELEVSRARYFDLYDLAPVGYFTLSEQGLILEANLTAAKLLGVARGALVKKPLSRFVLPGDQDIYYLHRKALLQTGAPQAWEMRVLKKDAAPLWVQAEATTAQDADGVSVWRAIVSDIAERKRAEKHAEEMRLRLAAIVESSQDAIISKTLDAKIVSWNSGADAIYGYTADEVVGQPISILLPPGYEDELPAIMKRIRRGEKVEHYETKRRRKDGTVIDVSVAVSPIKTPGGETVGASSVARNITENKQAAEIKQAAAMHRLLLARALSAQEEERRRIARELHDEAGQLLTSLLVGLRTLEDSRNIADARVKGHRLREITAQAMDEVSRLARGLHPSALDDHGLGVALSRYVSGYAKTHDIAVDLKLNELDFSDLPPAVSIGLYRIVQEAMTNIARHSGAKAVSIKFTRSAMALQVAVTDNGRGFDTNAVSVNTSSHLGIQGMRERAVMLGGTVRFSSKGTRTQILVQVPLTGQKDVHPSAPRTKI